MNNIYMILMVVMGFVLVACEKEITTPLDYSNEIEISIGSTENIGYHEATITGELGETYGQEICGYGHCWDTRPNPTVEEIDVGFGMTKTKKTFNTTLENLLPNQQYYVRAYYKIDKSIVYSSETYFITLEYKEPAVTTTSISNITSTSATSGGSITDDGGAAITSRGVCWNAIGKPTIQDNITYDGTGTGSFSSGITGLQPETDYYVRAYATNSLGTVYGEEITFTNKSSGTFTDDRDGNSYKWIRIGEQIWMTEDLAYLPYVYPYSDHSTTDPRYYVSEFNGTNVGEAKTTKNYITYGVLYNYIAATQIAPKGWHLPTDDEWKKLMMRLGLSEDEYYLEEWRGNDEGNKLKEVGTEHWVWSTGATNESGFTALPGGYARNDGAGSVGRESYFWSSNEMMHVLRYDEMRTLRKIGYKSYGFSVRCIKD